MEIEIGEYVRTKDGICKLLYKQIDGNGKFCGNVDKPFFLREDNIISHSKNIIDLIDYGDYVNGYKVIEIDEYKTIGDVLEKYLKVDCSKLLNVIYKKDIKTILTKEQMEANQYVVK